MHKRLIGYLIIFSIISSILIPININADENEFWNNSFSFKEEIIIPINTSNTQSKYQPIDIPIKFKNLCWAKDEDQHSIRVIFQDGNRHVELESQIYDLITTDENHISSCNLVFLIPEEATGNEKYFLYYDDEEKSSPNYKDRVNVQQSEYAYEPIQGLGFDSSYFLIKQDEEIIYGVNWEGKFLNDPVSQQVGKFKKNTKEIKPNNGEHTINFCFNYWRFKDNIWNLNSTNEEYVGSELLVDGNLMVKFGIVSRSKNGLLKSTVIYKYYFCPRDDKKIYSHVKHEVTGSSLPTGEEIDASYLTFYSGGFRSSSIEELNFGEIPPYLHYYSEEGSIREFRMNQFPENSDWEKYISKEDDFDLGSSAWVSVDYGETGKAFAIILSNNSIIKTGQDERDGIELQLYEAKNVNYPGLDGRFALLYLMRNDYEKGEPRDVVLPKNFVVEFDALYFTTEQGGFLTVDKEANIYQKLIAFQPEENNDIKDEEKKEEYSLTVFAHLPPDLFGSVTLSHLLLKKPAISIELLKDNIPIAIKKTYRIPLTGEIRIDWRNISLFRKAQFPKVEPQKYVVKVWMDNIIFKRDRQLIGYRVIDLSSDKRIRIFCTNEGKIDLTVFDQNDNGINDVQISLEVDGEIISTEDTNLNGKAIIKAPCGIVNFYKLNLTYKGFLISSENIRLGRFRQLIPIFKKYDFNVYDFEISFKDSNSNPPDFDVEVSLLSPEMEKPVILYPDDIENGIYRFNSLHPANYTLLVDFKSYEIEESINIPSIRNLDIELQDLSVFLKDDWDLAPNIDLDISLKSTGFKRNVILYPKEIEPGNFLFSNLYSGIYDLEIRYKDFSIEKTVEIESEKSKDLTLEFSAEFNLTAVILDSRGNPINGANVSIIRESRKIYDVTNEKGIAKFSIPPGKYYIDMYLDEEPIGYRKINVPSEKKYSIVTNNEPLLPYVVIFIVILFLLLFGIYCYYNKHKFLFLKILAVSLAIIALISPWWELSGSNSKPSTNTSTELYILPTEMITLTSNENVTAGDVLSLDKDFISAVDYLPPLIIVGIIIIVGSVILDYLNWKRFSFFINLTISAVFLASVVIFIVAMSQFTGITTGSVLGSGELGFDIPGENIMETFSCSWGFNLGFYLVFASAIIYSFLFSLNLRKILKDKWGKDI